MEFKREVNVGHLLTVVSVLIALSSLLYSQWRDRVQERAVEQAAIRQAAGAGLAELDRISNEIEIFFLEIEPEYVTVSEALSEHRDLVEARDELWRFISEKRTAMEQAIARGSGLSAAQAIARSDPELYADLQSVLRELTDLRIAAFADLQAATQGQVLSLELEGYTSAVLGNALRTVHARSQYDCRSRRDALTAPVRARLETLLVGLVGGIPDETGRAEP
jgi:hypothetical protein